MDVAVTSRRSRPRRAASATCFPALLVAALVTSSPEGHLEAQEVLRPAVQVVRDSLQLSSLSFERVLNTFLWNGSVLFDRRFDAIEVRLRQLLRSRLIRTDQRSVQDEYGDSLTIGVPISAQWKGRLAQISSVVSDNRAIDLTKLAQHRFLLGVQADPYPRLSFGLLGGYEIDAQQDERDEGFGYQLDVAGEDLRLEDFRGIVRGRWAQSFLTRRRPQAGNLDVQLIREFGRQARNTIVFSYNKLRREFYTAADQEVQRTFHISNNIFRRDAASVEVSDQLEYQPSGDMQVFFRGGLSNRTIDRALAYKVFSTASNPLLNTRIQEMQLFAEAGTTYQPESWLGLDLGISYREREERHHVTEEGDLPAALFERQQRSESRLESIAERTSVSTQIRAHLTESDDLNFAGSASILRYNTPDTTNVDERDELLVTFGFREIHRFTQSLILTLSGDVTLGHLVYLKSAQSANNNWNRIIRFSPAILYAPTEGFRTVNQAEVLGNYTVYDFENQGALTRSFSFRQASWLDSTMIQITELFSLFLVGEVRVYERGILRWAEFKERPQNYFLEQGFWPRIMFSPMRLLHLALGYRYFGQDRYRYQGGSRLKEHRLETSGPTVSVSWDGTDTQRLMLEGWNETQRLDGQVTRTVPNLSLKVLFSL
jgi:hypothetical protein